MVGELAVSSLDRLFSLTLERNAYGVSFFDRFLRKSENFGKVYEKTHGIVGIPYFTIVSEITGDSSSIQPSAAVPFDALTNPSHEKCVNRFTQPQRHMQQTYDLPG